eukprot:m.172151 g.172151  ORF g.172151 m.172151 type:complete len:486 (+) comp16714_c0_seq15:2170-3627(+)
MAQKPSNGAQKMPEGSEQSQLNTMTPAQQQQQFFQMQSIMQQQMLMNMFHQSQAQSVLPTISALSASPSVALSPFGAGFPAPTVLPTAQATLQPASSAVVYGPSISTAGPAPRASPELDRSSRPADGTDMLPPHMQQTPKTDVDQLEALVIDRIKQRQSEGSNGDGSPNGDRQDKGAVQNSEYEESYSASSTLAIAARARAKRPSQSLTARIPMANPPTTSSFQHGLQIPLPLAPLSSIDSPDGESRAKRRKGSGKRKFRTIHRGWCLTCNATKELEERASRNRRLRFQLCNACRKTHLTPRIANRFEEALTKWLELLRQEGLNPTEEEGVDNTVLDLKKEFGSSRMSRIMHLWVGKDMHFLPISHSTDIEILNIKPVLRDTAKSLLASDPELAASISGTKPFARLDGVKVMSQPYTLHHIDVYSLDHLKKLQPLALAQIASKLEDRLRLILVNPPYRESVLHMGLEPETIHITPDNLELMITLY